MGRSIKAIVYRAHGKPAEVLGLEEQELRAVGPDEALVRLRAAPINPADLNAIEGKYPVRPALPATPGFEGAGVVEEIGSAVRGLEAGAQVILPTTPAPGVQPWWWRRTSWSPCLTILRRSRRRC